MQQNREHASVACLLVEPESAMQSQEEQVSEHTGSDKELFLSKLLIFIAHRQFKHPQHPLSTSIRVSGTALSVTLSFRDKS